MTSRRKHHYVPQFYLKNFSSTTSGKEIGLFNHRKDIFIKAAPIKHQACEKLLYGENDEIEEALSKLEHYAAIIIARLISVRVPPPEETAYYKVLKEFVLYQLFRTVSAGKRINEMLSSELLAVFKQTSHYTSKYENLVFRHQQPTLLSLLNSIRAYPLMNHLGCKTIINLTDTPFITSDNPAVKYNQFLEGRQIIGGGIGLAVKGLEVFLPINPYILIVFYDPYIYKLKEKKERVLYTSNANDVLQLNALQYIHSNSQLFFSHGVTKRYIDKLVKQFASKRQDFTFTNTIYENRDLPTGEKKISFLNTFHEPKIKLDLSFIKLRKNAKELTLEDKFPPLRHDSFYDLRKQNIKTIEP